jgi:hypothetical protein
MQGAGAAHIGRQLLELRDHLLLERGALAGVEHPSRFHDAIKLSVG